MLDGWARTRMGPLLDAMGTALHRSGVSANAMTLAAFAVGMAAAAAIAFEAYWAGLVLLLASRLGDGLDGAIARASERTDLGGFLDIVLDFAFYGAIPLAFALVDPAANAVAAAALLFAFYCNGASFLAYAAVAARRGVESEVRGPKNIVFTAGLMEGTETIAFFCLMCLFPAWFATLALLFAGLTLYTAAARIMLAWKRFA